MQSAFPPRLEQYRFASAGSSNILKYYFLNENGTRCSDIGALTLAGAVAGFADGSILVPDTAVAARICPAIGGDISVAITDDGTDVLSFSDINTFKDLIPDGFSIIGKSDDKIFPQVKDSSIAAIGSILSSTATTFDDWTLISPATPANRDGVFIHAVDQDLAVRLQNVGETAPADAYTDDPTVAMFIVSTGKTVYVGVGEGVDIYGACVSTPGDCVVTEVV